MITEDRVTFEIAKLLKDKGFDVPCIGRYSVRSKEFHLDCTRLCNNGGLFEFSAPTLQMAMKWLRKVHNIDFTITPDRIENYTAMIFVNKELPFTTIGSFKTYEAACEAAIKYALENLI